MKLTPRRKLILTSAINSVGDTLDREEVEEIILYHGGDPAWIDNPPAWVEETNEQLRKHHLED